jgi:hypothetical protein
MSIPIKSPHFFAGTPRSSGDVFTGEVAMTRGGGQIVCRSGMYSGNPDGGIILVSGTGGRLCSVVLHGSPGNIWAQSGIPVAFYDSAPVFISGGPIPASGHRLIGLVNTPVGHSGQIAGMGQSALDMPFSSGLIARAASGAPGFTISFIPEVNPTNP